MNDMLVSVAVGLLCIAAVGMSATTLDSSVSTEPDDIISHEQFPISREDAAELKREVKSDGTNDQQGNDQQSEQSQKKVASENGDKEANKQTDGQSQTRKQPEQKQVNEQVSVQKESLIDRLIDFLKKWGPILLVVALVVGLAYRYRERLLALAAALVPQGSDSDDDSGPDRPWKDVDPRDEISRAWLAIARRTNVDSPRAKTTSEYADAAVEQGLDPDAVETVTREFEEVRYRGAEVTEERERRAKESREELDNTSEDGISGNSDARNRDRRFGGNRDSPAGGDD